jgi:hypothetical protein
MFSVDEATNIWIEKETNLAFREDPFLKEAMKREPEVDSKPDCSFYKVTLKLSSGQVHDLKKKYSVQVRRPENCIKVFGE